MIKIAPSLLAADFSNLQKQIAEVEQGGADWLHLDVMDGHYVPNITFGAPIISVIRKCTKLPLDVHLMIEEPEKYIESFKLAGADIITVHQETCSHLYRTIQVIKEGGCKAGVTINPSTPVEFLEEIIKEVDLVLIMTVEPGFGGQKFIKNTINKIQAAKIMIDKTERNIFLEVDGGIDLKTAPYVVNAGANVLVAGTSVFKSDSIKKTISALRAVTQNKIKNY
jgi:ribulose-phosphate 3-epimerase